MVFMANDDINHDGSNFNLKFDREVDANIAKLSPYMDFADYAFVVGCFILIVMVVWILIRVISRKFHQEK